MVVSFSFGPRTAEVEKSVSASDCGSASMTEPVVSATPRERPVAFIPEKRPAWTSLPEKVALRTVMPRPAIVAARSSASRSRSEVTLCPGEEVEGRASATVPLVASVAAQMMPTVRAARR
ncbi:Uncharacterised protein [Mycobacteroides abscessus]|nr:Uncharacterised protein [Mycobacteroides abscessus]